MHYILQSTFRYTVLFSTPNSTCEIGQVDILVSAAEETENQRSYVFNVVQLQIAQIVTKVQVSNLLGQLSF